jgi:Na+/melibiose symporter-like transporter
MTPEIAPRYDDSTAITSIRFFIGLLSGLVSLLAFDFIVGVLPTEQDGYSIAGLLFAFVAAAPSVLLFFTIPEKSSLLRMPELPKTWRKSCSDLLALAQNRAFVTVCFIYLLCWVTTNAIQSSLVLYDFRRLEEFNSASLNALFV